MVNPFHVPKVDDQRRPLCPWQHPEHLDHYAGVGPVGQSMDDLRSFLTLGAFPRERGRLIVVTGEGGCGKTSLAHWCAYQADLVTNQAVGRPLAQCIVDLSLHEYLKSAPNDLESAERTERAERAAQILTSVVQSLRPQLALPESWSSQVIQARHRDIYDELSQQAIDHKFTPIIILPTVAAYPDDLNEYYYLADRHGGLIFLTETSEDSAIDSIKNEDETHGRVLTLRTELISGDDGWIFVMKQLDRCGIAPKGRIREKDVDRLIREMNRTNCNSVRKLRTVLYYAWERHEHESSPGMVTDDDLLAQLPTGSRRRPWRK